MMKIVAINVVARQPPERRPTATPTARAKSIFPDRILLVTTLAMEIVVMTQSMN